MTPMRQLAQDSEQIGRELNVALTTPGIRQAELQQTLRGLAQQQQQGVTQARELDPPGLLPRQHQQAVDALELRVSGLRRLEDALPTDARSRRRRRGEVGGDLAAQTQRLLASDVIWEDLFYAPTVTCSRSEDVQGVDVPQSRFLQNTDLATQRGMTPIWQRIQGAATGGEPTGLHGNGIVSVKARPSGQVLRTDTDNTVTATADLAFDVTVENSGDSQEVQVVVRLTIEQSPSPITKTPDDPPDRRGGAADRPLRQPRPDRPVRAEDDAQGRGRAGAGRGRTPEQLRLVSGDLHADPAVGRGRFARSA